MRERWSTILYLHPTSKHWTYKCRRCSLAVWNATCASSNAPFLHLHLCLHLSTCPPAFMSGTTSCLHIFSTCVHTNKHLYSYVTHLQHFGQVLTPCVNFALRLVLGFVTARHESIAASNWITITQTMKSAWISKWASSKERRRRVRPWHLLLVKPANDLLAAPGTWAPATKWQHQPPATK